VLDWNSIAYNQERHRDFIREAEADRLAADPLASARDEPMTARARRWRAVADRLQCLRHRLSYTLHLTMARADC
jgi:hypothetical protein